MKLCGAHVRAGLSVLVVVLGLAACQQDEEAVRGHLGRNGNRGAGGASSYGTRHPNARADRTPTPRTGPRGTQSMSETPEQFTSRLVSAEWGSDQWRVRGGVNERISVAFDASGDFQIQTEISYDLGPNPKAQMQINTVGKFVLGQPNPVRHGYTLLMGFPDQRDSRVIVPAPGDTELRGGEPEIEPAAGSPEKTVMDRYFSDYSRIIPGKGNRVEGNTLLLFDPAYTGTTATGATVVQNRRHPGSMGFLELIKR